MCFTEKHTQQTVTSASLMTDAAAAPFWANRGIMEKLRQTFDTAPTIVQKRSCFSSPNVKSTCVPNKLLNPSASVKSAAIRSVSPAGAKLSPNITTIRSSAVSISPTQHGRNKNSMISNTLLTIRPHDSSSPSI